MVQPVMRLRPAAVPQSLDQEYRATRALTVAAASTADWRLPPCLVSTSMLHLKDVCGDSKVVCSTVGGASTAFWLCSHFDQPLAFEVVVEASVIPKTLLWCSARLSSHSTQRKHNIQQSAVHNYHIHIESDLTAQERFKIHSPCRDCRG